MWDMIQQMTEDRLWIYTGITGALLGAAFLSWFKDTKMGLWAFSKFDETLDYLVNRWGWTWLQEPEDVWRHRYPRITKKIDELEDRLNALENKNVKK